MPAFTVFKTALQLRFLRLPLQDRWSRIRTWPWCATCLPPRHAATLLFLSHQRPAASSQAERNNPDPSIIQGRTSRRQSARIVHPENARDCVISVLRPSKTTTDRITRYVCDGRAVLAGRQHANCVLDNCPPRPKFRPVSKHVEFLRRSLPSRRQNIPQPSPDRLSARTKANAYYPLLFVVPQRQSRVPTSGSMLEDFVADVRPELFCHVEERIQGYLLSPLVCRISE
jgi:hypothetical protein